MRDRLIDLIIQADEDALRKRAQEKAESNRDLYGFIADYLIDKGVVVPLYPYGTKIYFISYGENSEHGYHYVDNSIYSKHWLGVERELFLTKEEAEAKLAELKGSEE